MRRRGVDGRVTSWAAMNIAEPRAFIKQRAFPITRPAADAPVAVFVSGFALPKAENYVITIGADRIDPLGASAAGMRRRRAV